MKSIEIQSKTIDAAVEEGLEKLGCGYDEVDVEIISNGGMFKKAKVKLTVKKGVKEKKAEEKKEEKRAEKAEKKEIIAEKKVEEQPVKIVSAEKSEEPREQERSQPNSKPKFEKKSTPRDDSNASPREEGKPVAPGTSQKLDACLRFVQGLVSGLGNNVEVAACETENAYTININGEDVGRLIGKGGEALNALQVLTSSIAINNANGENKRVYVNIENYKERREETLKNIAKKKSEFVLKTGKSAKLEPMTPRDRAIVHTVVQEIQGVRSYSIGEGAARRLVIAVAREEKTKEDKPVEPVEA